MTNTVNRGKQIAKKTVRQTAQTGRQKDSNKDCKLSVSCLTDWRTGYLLSKWVNVKISNRQNDKQIDLLCGSVDRC